MEKGGWEKMGIQMITRGNLRIFLLLICSCFFGFILSLNSFLAEFQIYAQKVTIRIAQAKCPGLPQPAPGSPDPYTIIIDGAATAGVAIFAYYLARDIIRDRRNRAMKEERGDTTADNQDKLSEEEHHTDSSEISLANEPRGKEESAQEDVEQEKHEGRLWKFRIAACG